MTGAADDRRPLHLPASAEPSTSLARVSSPLGSWVLDAISLRDEATLVVRFAALDEDGWLEVTALAGDVPGPAFHRFENLTVRYRGRVERPTERAREEVRAIVLGVGASLDARLAESPGATLAEVLGRSRRGGRVVFGRDGLRAMLAPDIVEGVPIAGGWELDDVYPSSHSDKSGNPLLELILAFRHPDVTQPLRMTVARRDPERRAFVSTPHFSLSYRSAGDDEPPGASSVRALVAFVLQLRDTEALEVEFPDVLADVSRALLAAPVEPEDEPAPESSAALNLAIDADCGQSCVFCSVKELVPPTDGGDPVLARCVEDLRVARGRGVRTVRVNGFDPLEYSRILEVLRQVREQGFERAEVFSPCTRLADEAFCVEVVEALPDDRFFFVPLYAADAETHDRVVGTPGAHARVMRALDNLLRHAGARSVGILSVALRENLHALPELVALARRRGVSFSAHTAYPSHESRRDRYFGAVPRHTEVARALTSLYGRRRGGESFPVHGVPPCVTFRVMREAGVAVRRWLEVPEQPHLLPGTEYRAADFEHGAGDRSSSAFAATSIPCPHAGECALLPACGGEVLRAYVEAHGAEEFRPVSLKALIDAT